MGSRSGSTKAPRAREALDPDRLPAPCDHGLTPAPGLTPHPLPGSPFAVHGARRLHDRSRPAEVVAGRARQPIAGVVRATGPPAAPSPALARSHGGDARVAAGAGLRCLADPHRRVRARHTRSWWLPSTTTAWNDWASGPGRDCAWRPSSRPSPITGRWPWASMCCFASRSAFARELRPLAAAAGRRSPRPGARCAPALRRAPPPRPPPPPDADRQHR